MNIDYVLMSIADIKVDYKLLVVSFITLYLSIKTFCWYNNGKGAPLKASSKKIKLILASFLFLSFVFLFNLSFGNTDVFIPLFNNCISAFIGFSVATIFKNRML